MQNLTLELPVFWACALTYGEVSDFTEEELEQLAQFKQYMIDQFGKCHLLTVDHESLGFQKYHDATFTGVGFCEVCDYVFSI